MLQAASSTAPCAAALGGVSPRFCRPDANLPEGDLRWAVSSLYVLGAALSYPVHQMSPRWRIILSSPKRPARRKISAPPLVLDTVTSFRPRAICSICSNRRMWCRPGSAGPVFQPCDLAVAEGRQQLCVVALFVRGLSVGECRAPPEIDGLATRCAESEAADVKRLVLERHVRQVLSKGGHRVASCACRRTRAACWR